MGPGYDLNLLKKHCECTGSDKSPVFVKKYLDAHPDAKAITLDAVSMNVDKQFDCIYSNKALIHLSQAELIISLENQKKVLTPDGLIFHTFWLGKDSAEFNGLFFQYYSVDEIKTLFEKEYTVLRVESYSEMEKNDSCFIVCKAKVSL